MKKKEIKKIHEIDIKRRNHKFHMTEKYLLKIKSRKFLYNDNPKRHLISIIKRLKWTLSSNKKKIIS